MAKPTPPAEATRRAPGWVVHRVIATVTHSDRGGRGYAPAMRLGVASIALAAFLSASSALSVAPWLGPVRFFPPGSPFTVRGEPIDSVALNARGDALVGTPISNAGPARTVTPAVRERKGGRGSWSGNIALARPARDATAPTVALNATGSGLAVFRRSGRYLSARRGLGGRWRLTGPIALASSSDLGSDLVRVALTDGGWARVALAHAARGCDSAVTACPWTVEVYQQRTVTGPWSRLGDPLELRAVELQPSVAMSRRGDLLVAWKTPGTPRRLLASRRLAAESAFEPPQAVSGPGLAKGDLGGAAIGDRGDAALAWVLPDPPSGAGVPGTGRGQVALRSAASPRWGAPQDLVPPGTSFAGGLSVAVDANGNAAAGWTVREPLFGEAGEVVRAASRGAAAGRWKMSPELVFRGRTAIQLGIAQFLLERGRTFVVWERYFSDRPNYGGPAWAQAGLTIWDPLDPSPGAYPRVFYLSTMAYMPGQPPKLASAPNGRLISVERGMKIRNYDSLVTPAGAQVISPRVLVSGRFATVTFRLSLASRVYLRRSGPDRLSGPFRSYAVRVLRAGSHRLTLGRLARGAYRLEIGACHASRGCGAIRSLDFGIE